MKFGICQELFVGWENGVFGMREEYEKVRGSQKGGRCRLAQDSWHARTLILDL